MRSRSGASEATPSFFSPQSCVDYRERMDLFKDRKYHQSTRLLLSFAGLWPYHDAKVKLVGRLAVFLVLSTFVIAQVFNIVSSGYDLEVIIEGIPIILTILICFVKYATVCFQDDAIRNIFDSMIRDWDTLIVKNDRDILWQSAADAKQYVSFFIVSTYVLTTAYLMSPLLPFALDVIAPSNDSHTHDHPLIMIYSYQKPKHLFYLSLLHIYVSIVYLMTIILATDTSYIIIVLHACGLFDLIGARFSYAFECCSQSTCGTGKNCTSLRKVICAAMYHKRAIRYTWLINSCYAMSYIIQLVIIVTIFSVLLLCLHQAITVSQDMDKVLMYGSHSIGLPFLVFLNVVPAQELMDHSVDVFHKVYSGHWYMGPIRTQKMLLMVMHRSVQPCTIAMVNTLTPSFEMFASIMQTSFSYFMVLYSMH